MTPCRRKADDAVFVLEGMQGFGLVDPGACLVGKLHGRRAVPARFQAARTASTLKLVEVPSSRSSSSAWKPLLLSRSPGK